MCLFLSKDKQKRDEADVHLFLFPKFMTGRRRTEYLIHQRVPNALMAARVWIKKTKKKRVESKRWMMMIMQIPIVPF